ncbi:hypothetical protein KSP40_PGU008089 [Platanthera guangdongensis]|uniref:Initiator tRNA phosphoribosyl transferase family protein n=1 Tax=Platanthera guangdongensis TaxID=2320717 RepID=A0ABR2N3E7_9ASPA
MSTEAAAADPIEEEGLISIYRMARRIKKRDNSIFNALRSIYEDSIFVGEIAGLWPDLPLVANLRCGLWYSRRFDATCYFKSTDGHANNWSFSTSRLNLHLAFLAGQRGGCIIVDSTRKGKRFPDSMSKTIPVWACVLNRAIERRLRKTPEQVKGDGQQATAFHPFSVLFVSYSLLELKDLRTSSCKTLEKNMPPNWDCTLHLPLWVSNTERASIEHLIEEWTRQLEACGADIDSLASIIVKPLRPLWISQKTVIWLNEVPEYDSWNFTPIILVSASASHGKIQLRSTSEYSWHYIPGAGDDEESWARGLHPNLFWKKVYDIIDSGPSMCNQKVSELVEKDRVYRAQRCDFSPPVTASTCKKLANNGSIPGEQSCLSVASELSISKSPKSPNSECALFWIGLTNLAVGTAVAGSEDGAGLNGIHGADCVLNCDPKSASYSTSNDEYLDLPILSSKLDRFSLISSLYTAIKFAELHLKRGKRLLICCHNADINSVCDCLSVLLSFTFESFISLKGSQEMGTKQNVGIMERRLRNCVRYGSAVLKARERRGKTRITICFFCIGLKLPI